MKAADALDHGLRPWLLACAALTTLPHLQHRPLWLGALLLALLAWSVWLWRRRGALPGRWACALLAIGGVAATLYEHRMLFGRDPGVTLLILFMALKLLETRQRRDVPVVVMLGFFLLLTHYFYSQSMFTGLWLLGSTVVLSATLLRLNSGPAEPPRRLLRHAGQLVLQAVPLMLLLFLLFPRVSGPLWGLPADAHRATSGLSDSMAPGSISELVQNDEIAFRVRFAGDVPPHDKLYWRGPVFEHYDGRTWRPEMARRQPEQVEASGPPIAYETTLEPLQQPWALALDAPVGGSADAYTLNGTLTALRRGPVGQRQRLALQAALSYRFNVEESPTTLARNLRLPEGNPRARALAAGWRSAGLAPPAIVAEGLRVFAGNFAYTLQPPLYGAAAIDEFVFDGRRGFCEHFASAFVFLMRAAGVPARVVAGYQGGEVNPVDGFLVVRQSDAHAWAEVWLAGRGWQRVDPTFEVAPARIENGLARAMPGDTALPPLLQWRNDWLRGLQHRWDALNNSWNQYVLGYSPQRQRDLLAAAGLPDADWRQLAALLAAGCALAMTALLAWTLYRRPPGDPAVQLWHKTLARLARRQVNCAPAETPAALLARVRQERPELAAPLAEVVDAYQRVRYGDEPGQLARLRRAVARLP